MDDDKLDDVFGMKEIMMTMYSQSYLTQLTPSIGSVVYYLIYVSAVPTAFFPSKEFVRQVHVMRSWWYRNSESVSVISVDICKKTKTVIQLYSNLEFDEIFLLRCCLVLYVQVPHP